MSFLKGIQIKCYVGKAVWPKLGTDGSGFDSCQDTSFFVQLGKLTLSWGQLDVSGAGKGILAIKGCSLLLKKCYCIMMQSLKTTARIEKA